MRRLVFLIRVQAAAHSGLISFWLHPSEMKAIDVVLVKYLRSLLQGKAAGKDEAGKYTCLSASTVFTGWRLAPTSLDS